MPVDKYLEEGFMDLKGFEKVKRYHFEDAVKEIRSGSISDIFRTDPQYARLLSDGRVIMSFRVFGYYTFPNRIFTMPIVEESKERMTKLCADYLRACLDRTHIKVLVNEVDTGEITLDYKPASSQELESIRKLLESIPLEGGELPQKGQTFFGYD